MIVVKCHVCDQNAEVVSGPGSTVARYGPHVGGNNNGEPFRCIQSGMLIPPESKSFAAARNGLLDLLRAGAEPAAALEAVDHPGHYGGAGDPYEAIKVIAAWKLNFNLGSVLKYIRRAGRKPNQPTLIDLKKARFYLDWEIDRIEREEARKPCDTTDRGSAT